MSNNSEITPSLPPAVQRVSSTLKWSGSIGFWLQLVLGVVSAVILLVASPSLISGEKSSQGTGFGIFCAIAGLIALGASIYFSFRYMNIAKLLRNRDPAQRPNRTDTLGVIKLGLMVNFVGMLLTIFGAQAIVGTVLLKSLTQSSGWGAGGTWCVVTPIDLFVVQANTNTIAAHFAGIVVSLWLLNRITR
ncbi:MAG: DUF3611 family protein [Xenococcaceae cyanobacterium]